MTKGQIWIKAEPVDEGQRSFGEKISILVTDPEDCNIILFKAGPYVVPSGEMVTHEQLAGLFPLENIPSN